MQYIILIIIAFVIIYLISSMIAAFPIPFVIIMAIAIFLLEVHLWKKKQTQSDCENVNSSNFFSMNKVTLIKSIVIALVIPVIITACATKCTKTDDKKEDDSSSATVLTDNVETESENDTVSETTRTVTTTETTTTAINSTTSVTTSASVTEYDALQSMFLKLTYNVTSEEIENWINENSLCYTREEYNSKPKDVVYKIAFTEGTAVQRYADSGDYLKIAFNRDDGSFMYAHYYHNAYTALLYNYGTYNSFHEEKPSEISGYYVNNEKDNMYKSAVEVMSVVAPETKDFAQTETTTTTIAPATESVTSESIITETEYIEPETKPVHEPEPEQELEPEMVHFIINTDTGCVHTKESCRAAQKILAENYATIDISEDEISNYAYQYWACGICAKKYGDLLPKFE